MRSLWRRMALRWLCGRASERLTGDSLIDALMAPVTVAAPTFLVTRRCEVSPHAIMVQADGDRDGRQTAFDEALAERIDKSDAV